MQDDPSGWASWLEGKGRNVTSQFGEDGLVAAALSRIGITNQWCFEVGAHDGLYFSNTKWMRDDGWNAVLIESVRDHYVKLEALRTDKVHCIHATVGQGDLDRILRMCGAPESMDFGCIDIDGQDYWVWKTLVTRPRVMLVEYGYWNKTGLVPPEGSPEVEHQAGLETICELGRAKGYVPLVSTYCNVLFVDKEVWESN